MPGLLDPELSSFIKAQDAMLHPLAMRLQGRDGADYDDLMQEGRISVWQDLENGREPQQVYAWQRMLKWLRHIKIQSPQPYTDMLQVTDG